MANVALNHQLDTYRCLSSALITQVTSVEAILRRFFGKCFSQTFFTYAKTGKHTLVFPLTFGPTIRVPTPSHKPNSSTFKLFQPLQTFRLSFFCMKTHIFSFNYVSCVTKMFKHKTSGMSGVSRIVFCPIQKAIQSDRDCISWILESCLNDPPP